MKIKIFSPETESSYWEEFVSDDNWFGHANFYNKTITYKLFLIDSAAYKFSSVQSNALMISV